MSIMVAEMCDAPTPGPQHPLHLISAADGGVGVKRIIVILHPLNRCVKIRPYKCEHLVIAVFPH